MNRKEKRAHKALLDWGRAMQIATAADEARAKVEDTGEIVNLSDEAAKKIAVDAQEADEALEKAKTALFEAIDELPLKLALSTDSILQSAMLVSVGYTVGANWDNDSIWDWISAVEDKLYELVVPLLESEDRCQN